MNLINKVSGGEHLRRMYPITKGHLEKHGQSICKDMNCILAYHITNINDTNKEMTVFVDMKNRHGNQYGMILLKESLDQLPQDKRNLLAQGKGYESGSVKPDVTLKMTEKTFDALSEGKISGFRGWLTGSVKVSGSINLLCKYDDKVMRKYNSKEGYAKTPRRD